MKKFLLILIVSCFGMMNVNALSNPYSKYETLTLGDDHQKVKLVSCTWYAWKMASEKGGVDLPSLGNASNWYSNAQKKGYSVGTKAKRNSIVVYKTKSKNGHVAYVNKVDGSYMYIDEGGIYDKDKVISDDCIPGINELGEEDCKYTATITYKAINGNGIINNNKVLSSGSRTEDEGSSKIIGFIYLDETVKTTTKSITTTKSTTIKTTSKPTTTMRVTTTTSSTQEVENTTTTTEKTTIKINEEKDSLTTKNKINNKIIIIIVISGFISLVIIFIIMKKKI